MIIHQGKSGIGGGEEGGKEGRDWRHCLKKKKEVRE